LLCIKAYNKPWYLKTPIISDIIIGTGDLVMIATLSDMNPFTGEFYTPGDRFKNSFGSFLDSSFTVLGVKYLVKQEVWQQDTGVLLRMDLIKD
jgi:hypothetical protein